RSRRRWHTGAGGRSPRGLSCEARLDSPSRRGQRAPAAQGKEARHRGAVCYLEIWEITSLFSRLPMRRVRALNAVRDLFRTHPVVTLVGPRQCGKTTLAKDLATAAPYKHGPVTRFDLESPVDLARLDNPMLALEPLEGLVIIDEVQRRPELFPTLRVL